MKITCQHCGIHHRFTAEEIVAAAEAIKRVSTSLPADVLGDAVFGAYAVEVLKTLAVRMPEIEPPRNDTLVVAVAKLQNFKSYVHERLDKMGVSKSEGEPCRIGARLDIVAHTMHRMEGLDK